MPHFLKDRPNMVFIVFLLIIYFVLQPSVFGSITNTFSPGGDQHFLINPVISYLSGSNPYFDPTHRLWYGEFDLYHNPHFNVKYPFFFTWLGDFGGYLPTSHKAFLIAHFHHIVAGINMYIFARCVDLKPIAAFAAAIFFMFCYNNTLLSPFYWRLAATAWTPLALAGVWLCSRGQSPLKGILIGAPAIMLLIFAKSTQPLLYFVVLAAAVGFAGLMYSALEFKDKKVVFYRSIVPTLGLAFIALLLAAPVLLHVILNQSDYIRWTSNGPVTSGFKVPFEASLEMAYPSTGLFNLFVPIAKLPTIGSTFAGGFIILSAVTVFLTKKLRILSLTLLFFGIYFTINGLGNVTPLPYLTYQIPMLSSIRQLTSHYIVVSFAMAIIIGISAHFFFEAEDKHARRKHILVASVFCGVLTTILLWQLPDILEHRSLLAKIALVVTPTVFAATLYLNGKQQRAVLLSFAAVLMVLPSAELRSARTLNATKNPLYTRSITQDILSAWDYVASETPNAIVSSDMRQANADPKNILTTFQASSLALYYRLRPFNASMSPRPKAEFQRINFLNRNPQLLIERGVRYHITNSDDLDPAKTKGMKIVRTFGNISVFKVEDPRRRLQRLCAKNKPSNSCPNGHALDIRSSVISQNQFNYTVVDKPGAKVWFYAFENPNWIVRVNEQTIQPTWVGKDKMTFELPSKASEIEIRYAPRGLIRFWVLWFIGVAMYVVVAFMQKRNKSKVTLGEFSQSEANA